MTLHIITVAFTDSHDLASTYASCQTVMTAMPDHLQVFHWIFVKRFSECLQARYPNAYLRPSHDTGIYNAMNLAFDALRSRLDDRDVLVYVNAGDHLDAASLVQHIIVHERATADISLAAATLTRHGVPVGMRPAPRHPSTIGRIIYSQYPCHQSTFYSAGYLRSLWLRRECIFVEEFRACADLDLYLLAQGAHIVTSSFVTSAYDTGGFSAQQSVMVAREKTRLASAYRAALPWRLYSYIWLLKARLVAPKRALRRLLGVLE